MAAPALDLLWPSDRLGVDLGGQIGDGVICYRLGVFVGGAVSEAGFLGRDISGFAAGDSRNILRMLEIAALTLAAS